MANELILAVDDEAHILELLSFNLEASGYRVVTAATGEDALVVCAHERPAMVLLDIMLPGIDGMEVCRRLKSAPTTADIPIIMLTAKGDEVDKIYVQLKQYESEIKESNRKLEQMFQSNLGYYHELVKYILAGEQGCQEIAAYIDQRRTDLEQSGDQSIQFELQTLEQAQMMLEQRTQDLRIAENVAMQSIPMIKTMEFTNMNLVRKINSAFIITLPVFKQALAQAILLKRQRIQAEAMSALDEKTNEMLLRNAQNTADQSRMTARMASGSSVKIETLEKTWKTIVQGIDDTRKIQEDARRQREQDAERLRAIQGEFEQMMRGQNGQSAPR